MAQVGPATTPGVRTDASTGMVEWSAVFAGAVTAAALSFVLLTFGSAIGLSATSPWPGSGMSAKTIASLAIFWAMAQQIGALMVGGYIAGRMRSRWAGASRDDVEFRDGLHGALVWAVGIIIGAALILSAAIGTAKLGADAAGKAASAASSNSDQIAYFADSLLRPAPRANAAPGQGQGATRIEPVPAETRAELARIMSRSLAAGSLSDNDRSYLATIVAQRTGVSQADAEKRVTDVYAETTRVTREAADKARYAAILTGFVTAASLILSLGAAWWAAMRGGHHRDNSIPARFSFAPPRRVS
jgi:hypothetical protein